MSSVSEEPVPLTRTHLSDSRAAARFARSVTSLHAASPRSARLALAVLVGLAAAALAGSGAPGRSVAAVLPVLLVYGVLVAGGLLVYLYARVRRSVLRTYYPGAVTALGLSATHLRLQEAGGDDVTIPLAAVGSARTRGSIVVLELRSGTQRETVWLPRDLLEDRDLATMVEGGRAAEWTGALYLTTTGTPRDLVTTPLEYVAGPETLGRAVAARTRLLLRARSLWLNAAMIGVGVGLLAANRDLAAPAAIGLGLSLACLWTTWVVLRVRRGLRQSLTSYYADGTTIRVGYGDDCLRVTSPTSDDILAFHRLLGVHVSSDWVVIPTLGLPQPLVLPRQVVSDQDAARIRTVR